LIAKSANSRIQTPAAECIADHRPVPPSTRQSGTASDAENLHFCWQGGAGLPHRKLIIKFISNLAATLDADKDVSGGSRSYSCRNIEYRSPNVSFPPPMSRISCIVVAQHRRRWWDAELAAEPKSNVIVQPSNRGTANGILLRCCTSWPATRMRALFCCLRIITCATSRFLRPLSKKRCGTGGATRSCSLARNISRGGGSRPGLHRPGSVDGPAVWTVSRFVEKPNAPLAQVLITAGALWNAFIVAAHAQALLQMPAKSAMSGFVLAHGNGFSASARNGKAAQIAHLP